MIQLHLPFTLSRDTPNCLEIRSNSPESIEEAVHQATGLTLSSFYLLHNGKKIDVPQSNGIVHAVLRLRGGKGGFGSMLRAIGAQIEKTTNREACRDLSGRRLRDINEERKLKNWIAQKEEREREAQERKRKRLERMCQEPKIELKDETFHQLRGQLTENMSDSVELGLQVGGSVKRKCDESSTTAKKPKKGLLLNDIDSDIDFSSDSDEEPESSNESNGLKVEKEKSSDEELRETEEVTVKEQSSIVEK